MNWFLLSLIEIQFGFDLLYRDKLSKRYAELLGAWGNRGGREKGSMSEF